MSSSDASRSPSKAAPANPFAEVVLPPSPPRADSPVPHAPSSPPPEDEPHNVVELPSSSAPKRELSQAELARDLNKEYAPDGVATYRCACLALSTAATVGSSKLVRLTRACTSPAAASLVRPPRHLLSVQTHGPSNPLRVIAHCDVDAAYARESRAAAAAPTATRPADASTLPARPPALHPPSPACAPEFEAKRLGLDNSVPIAVQQWQGLIAINYAARAFGITRHENIQEARKKCPELIVCHVATLKDGDDEPRYHEKPSMHNHKVCARARARFSRLPVRTLR